MPRTSSRFELARRERFLSAGAGLAAALLIVSLAGCHGLEPKSHGANPFGWPAKTLALGAVAADSELPLYRELGRVASASGDLLESPALLVEGIVTLDRADLTASVEKLVAGTGGTLTALINVPFFFATGGNVDLGRDEAIVNEALAWIESVDPAAWRLPDAENREHIYPTGTRVEASGRNLIWHVPGEGTIVQSAEISPTLAIGLGLTGMAHVAQARTWGFVVGDRHKWEQCSPRLRAVIIVHEFFHQHRQIRHDFHAWSLLYWPAYAVGAISDDAEEHWAENGGPDGAYVVNHALASWRTEAPEGDDVDTIPAWIEAAGQ